MAVPCRSFPEEVATLMDDSLKGEYIAALRQDFLDLQSQCSRQADEIDNLKEANRDLEREVDWLRDRLSEKPYA